MSTNTRPLTRLQKFFFAMSAAIRVRMGTALYVGESTALEMCVLGSLDWPSDIKEADIALGWLMCCSPDLEAASDQHGRNGYRDRAAECAELATIACHVVWSHDSRWNTLVDNLPACGSSSLGINAGSRDRARAAWLFMVEQIDGMAYQSIPMKDELRYIGPLSARDLSDTYRREYLRMGA